MIIIIIIITIIINSINIICNSKKRKKLNTSRILSLKLKIEKLNSKKLKNQI